MAVRRTAMYFPAPLSLFPAFPKGCRYPPAHESPAGVERAAAPARLALRRHAAPLLRGDGHAALSPPGGDELLPALPPQPAAARRRQRLPRRGVPPRERLRLHRADQGGSRGDEGRRG